MRFQSKAYKSDEVMHVSRKKDLRAGWLNTDGLSEESMEDIRAGVLRRKPDLFAALETKRREEDLNTINAGLEGYDLREVRRSDLAGDKAGGGIAIWCRQSEGLVFKPHKPALPSTALSYVNNERAWTTVTSSKQKTAFCVAYMACQHTDDRFHEWNRALYDQILWEQAELRKEGYRTVLLGDMNGHVGDKLGEGVPGNIHGINPNGHLFLSFLDLADMTHINGATRVPGDWSTRLTKGMWTRQRGNSSSIIDYVSISREHLSSVVSMSIDDSGSLGGDSDHNWCEIILSDTFMRQHRRAHVHARKDRWDIQPDQDWSHFGTKVDQLAQQANGNNVEELSSNIASCLLNGLSATIGLKSRTTGGQSRRLPPDLILELKKKRQLSKVYKSKVSELTGKNLHRTPAGVEEIGRSEAIFIAQKEHTKQKFDSYLGSPRASIVKKCSGGSRSALQAFWSYVSTKVHKPGGLSAVQHPTSGKLVCSDGEIVRCVEAHLCTLFNGGFEEQGLQLPRADDHSYSGAPAVQPANYDHSYSRERQPRLSSTDNSASLPSDPVNWLGKDYDLEEVTRAIKTLKGGKACGWDKIPNEALINSPTSLLLLIVKLFNMVKKEGVVPRGWRRGLVTLVHKKGPREDLGNYRPLTVLVSLCGTYSRVLNSRLVRVVETHRLLGEDQNGFRQGRACSDNSFILDTILWKAKALGKKAHLGFVDIQKAYDTVDRGILWSRLSSMGIGGKFLESLQAMYTGDHVTTDVNGTTTRPVYLGRGLRQGCSLSPILFALYVRDLGIDLSLAGEGFSLSGVNISGVLFADDIVCIASSREGLTRLLSLVNSHCAKLKLKVSVSKSQVVGPGDAPCEVLGDHGTEAFSLKSVAMYKYLGVNTYADMRSTVLAKQELCVRTATKMKFACLYVSRQGPDVVDAGLCTWSNVGIPTVLFGCDHIPFTDTRIKEVERQQAQVAKSILGVPVSTANLCAQSELGLKPFRQLLYEQQLQFFSRLLGLPRDRWARLALMEHISGGWQSTYLSYLTNIRCEVNAVRVLSNKASVALQVGPYFLQQFNKDLAALDLPAVSRLKSLCRATYVSEGAASQALAQFRLANAGLGNRAPIPGHNRKQLCPVCELHPNNECHLVFGCCGVVRERRDLGISRFLGLCSSNGLDLATTYRFYMEGRDSDGSRVSKSDYLDRGEALVKLRCAWLGKWC